MVEEELGFLDWAKKVNERLTFLQLNIIEHKDLSEDDLFLLEVLHRTWYQGDMSFYQTKMDMPVETTEQTGLFESKSPENCPLTDIAPDGTVIAEAPVNQKEKKNE